MTTPRELSLRSVKGGYVLMSNPVRELEALRIATKSAGFQLDENSNEEEILDDSFDMSKCELVFDFDFKGTSPDTLRLVLENSNKEKLTIGLSFVENNLFVDRSSSGEIRFSDGFGKIARAPYKPDKTLKLRLLLDASSVEIFADGGSPVLTALFFTSEEFTNLKLFSKGGSSITGSCKFHELADTWHSGS